MTIRPITTASVMDVAVAPERVLEHSRTAVESVATRLWAGESVCVGPQLPSVTNYVTVLRVGGRSFVAKYSLLGTSLVSVVRGLRGTWPEVKTSQRAYVANPQGLLAREHAQLRALATVARRGALPLRVPQIITYEAGVLITVAVAAPSLSTELLRGSQHPGRLLTHVADTARRLQCAFNAGNPALGAVMSSNPHSSIAGTYVRKFLSPRRTHDYLAALGDGWAGPAERREIQNSLNELRSVPSSLLCPTAAPVVIYGDLKPEHVLLETAGWQTWVDPGLQRADPAAELAKLVSRTALLLVTTQPPADRTSTILDALDQRVTEFLSRESRGNMHMLRRLLALWLADWSNYLATGLSLPPQVPLPLPPMLLAATTQSRALLLLATDIAAQLVTNPAHAWCVALHGCHQLACGQSR
ncbi:MAG: phosphotransferase [Pseudonocardiaceae bacterium]